VSRSPIFPFSALVGQESLKLALLLSAVQPRLGGVLLRGEKGTAKSTAARGLASLLPGKAPFKTLPLGATEDRLAGGLDLEATLAQGRAVFQPGLLAQVHGGVLYVDEVNLLDDHLVDLVLDAAESGINRVEREGLSVCHPAEFALLGTMNPEEGSLRPQLLDRFGFCVDIESEKRPEDRVTLMEAREAFEKAPADFCAQWSREETALGQRLTRARQLLPQVRVPRHVQTYIAEICKTQNTAGHRADLVLARGAAAHSAWEGRDRATPEDVLAVLEFALAHRRRDSLDAPPPPPPPEPEDSEDPQQQDPPPPPDGPPPPQTAPPEPETGPAPDQAPAPPPPPGSTPDEDLVLGVGEPFKVRHLSPHEDRLARKGSGHRQRTRSADRRGRYVRSRPCHHGLDLAIDATLRASAPHQLHRRSTSSMKLVVKREDWQAKVRERRTGSFILFVVDASGSMGARGRMVASKGAILSLLLDAYQKRDKVGLIAFRRREAELVLPPTASIDLASRILKDLPVGGRTPLASALVKAYETLRPLLTREPNLRPLAILISDGRANAGLEGPGSMEEACRIAARVAQDERIRWIVVDTEDTRGVRLRQAPKVAAALGAQCLPVEDLRAEDLVRIVKGNQA